LHEPIVIRYNCTYSLTLYTSLNLWCLHPIARVISYDVGFNPSLRCVDGLKPTAYAYTPDLLMKWKLHDHWWEIVERCQLLVEPSSDKNVERMFARTHCQKYSFTLYSRLTYQMEITVILLYTFTQLEVNIVLVETLSSLIIRSQLHISI
jgi:hypothetical protein